MSCRQSICRGALTCTKHNENYQPYAVTQLSHCIIHSLPFVINQYLKFILDSVYPQDISIANVAGYFHDRHILVFCMEETNNRKGKRCAAFALLLILEKIYRRIVYHCENNGTICDSGSIPC